MLCSSSANDPWVEEMGAEASVVAAEEPALNGWGKDALGETAEVEEDASVTDALVEDALACLYQFAVDEVATEVAEEPRLSVELPSSLPGSFSRRRHPTLNVEVAEEPRLSDELPMARHAFEPCLRTPGGASVVEEEAEECYDEDFEEVGGVGLHVVGMR